METTFLFKKINNPITSLECISDIKNVIDGLPPKDERQLWMDAAKCSYGFGNGAIESIDALGESVVCNGIAYTKSANQSSPRYYQLVTGQKFMTSWLFSLPLNPTPQWTVSRREDFSEGAKFTLVDVYQVISDKIKKPFVVTGIIHFAEMHKTAIAKAPIENINIFEHMDIYYPNKNDIALRNQYGVIIGLVADIPAITDVGLSQAIQKVVYFNPLEKGKSALTTHEHGLVLNKKIAAIEDVTLADVADVCHLFTDSIVTRFNLNIYEVVPGSIILGRV